jgi:hypothetical protein
LQQLLNNRQGYPTIQQWQAALFAWNEEVRAEMESLGCFSNEIAEFWSISPHDVRKEHPRGTVPIDSPAFQHQMHGARLNRLKEIMNGYARKADEITKR